MALDSEKFLFDVKTRDGRIVYVKKENGIYPGAFVYDIKYEREGKQPQCFSEEIGKFALEKLQQIIHEEKVKTFKDFIRAKRKYNKRQK